MWKGFAAAALGCVACSPSVTTLLARHQWDDAMCSVRDARDVELAVPARLDAANARVRTREIVRADLQGVPDTIANDFFARYHLAIVDFAPRAPNALTLSVANGQSIAERLESLTGEPSVSGHTERRSVWTPRFAQPGDSLPLTFFMAIITAGISVAANVMHTEERDVYIEPSDEELQAVAPRATTLAAALHQVVAPNDLTHAYAFAQSTSPLTLSVDVHVQLSACDGTARYTGGVAADWIKLTSLERRRASVRVDARTVGTIVTVPISGRTVDAIQAQSGAASPVVVADVDPPDTDPAHVFVAEGQPHEDLVHAGAIALLASYGLSLISGWIGDAICNGSCKDHAYDLLYLPLAGPVIAAALPGVQQRSDASFVGTLLVVDSVVQTAAALTILVGTLWHHKVPAVAISPRSIAVGARF